MFGFYLIGHGSQHRPQHTEQGLWDVTGESVSQFRILGYVSFCNGPS